MSIRKRLYCPASKLKAMICSEAGPAGYSSTAGVPGSQGGGARRSQATFGKRPDGQPNALPTLLRALRIRGVSRPGSSKPDELRDAPFSKGEVDCRVVEVGSHDPRNRETKKLGIPLQVGEVGAKLGLIRAPAGERSWRCSSLPGGFVADVASSALPTVSTRAARTYSATCRATRLCSSSVIS